jgi:invasion protein IalB
MIATVPPSVRRPAVKAALALSAALALLCAPGFPGGALAKDKTTTQTKTDAAKSNKPDPKAKDAKPAKTGEPGKAVQLGTFGEWGAYATQGKPRTCYALAQPKSREPASIKRDPAYVFISTRPSENVKSEISVIMGFPMKDGSEATAEIGEAEYSLIAKGSNAWVKNPAEEGRLIDAMKKGSKLVVKATSAKGKASTDTYSLSGLGQALDKARKECQ